MKLITWNMQGGAGSNSESKWLDGVATMMRDKDVGIVCLQEAGQLPGSAVQVQASLQLDPQFNLYSWQKKYISHYGWDAQGGRVNLAIVTTVLPLQWAYLYLDPPIEWRPIIGVQLVPGGMWYICIHAISPGGPDVNRMLAAIQANIPPQPWFLAGDFNREPPAPGAVIAGNVCPPDYPTYSTTAPEKKYDYAITSAAARTGVRQGITLSDHLAVLYNNV